MKLHDITCFFFKIFFSPPTLFFFIFILDVLNNLGLQGQQQRGVGTRPPCQRPYSFTSGQVPELEFSEALGMQLGTVLF
jgi:hypothetical protein